MNRWLKVLSAGAIGIGVATSAVVAYIAFPGSHAAPLPPPLEAIEATVPNGNYIADLDELRDGFRAQRYRSFCGPASIETVARAYGLDAEQTAVFPSLSRRLDIFFTGTSLAQLEELAEHMGLEAERVHASSLSIDAFRNRLKDNLSRKGDFVLVNYDRRALRQEGAGHISAVAAYDETRDRFLVLDEAAYKYPFTWIPTDLLWQAVHTRASEGWRGVLFISAGRVSSPR